MGTGNGEKPLSERFSLGTRSQNEVLSVVLVFGMVIIGAVAVIGLGATAIGDTETQLSEDRAEKTLTQLDSKAALVALGEADSQNIGLPDEDFDVDENAGSLTIEIVNRTTGTPVSWGDPLMDVTLGEVRFEGDDAKIAYQGGGVFRTGGNNGTMVSPPEFHYRNGTLTLPIVNITNGSSLQSSGVITHSNESTIFPRPNDIDRTNPLDNHEVAVVVESEYYEGWGQYFEERTDGEVEYNHTTETVTITLVVPDERGPVQAGIVSGATGSMEIENAVVDSYNSSTGSFGSSSGKVVVAGDLDLEQQAEVFGDVEVGGEIRSPHPQARIYDGNISTGGGSDINSCSQINWQLCVDNWEAVNASVEIPKPVDRLIERQLEERSDPDNNDNAAASAVNESVNELDCSGTCELTAGSYYFDDLRVDGDILELNTTEGEISIAVENQFYIDGEVRVIGNNRVNVYVNDSFDTENSFRAGNYTSITRPSTQFWVYLPSDGSAQLGNNGEFVGVVYGPGGVLTDGAEIDIGTGLSGAGGLKIWGGLLGDIKDQVNNADVHFDEELLRTKTITEDSTVIRITYLHVTTNEIEID